MPLPEWTDQGLLPIGLHSASLDEIRERFVLGSPNPEHRELLFDALCLYLRLVRRLIPTGRAWVDGGFVTAKADAPHDVDVVLHPGDWAALESLSEPDRSDLLGLLTLQDVIVGAWEPPIWVDRVQPVGGALDGFICWPGQERYWMDTWAAVKGPDGEIIPDAIKGFVEVSW